VRVSARSGGWSGQRDGRAKGAGGSPKKNWLFTDFWNLLKERQPQGGFTIDSRGFQPAAMNAVTHIFQKTVMNQKT
jgi:hypothetical protein